jgi:hypothetical protein
LSCQLNPSWPVFHLIKVMNNFKPTYRHICVSRIDLWRVRWRHQFTKITFLLSSLDAD